MAQGSAARFYYPNGVAVDSAGNVYVADTRNEIIRKINSNGVVSTLAGLAGELGSDDGVGSNARFGIPTGVATDSVGNVYVADSGNHTIRKITSNGAVSTLAGSAGEHGSVDGIGSSARFYFPWAVAADRVGNIYVGDEFNSIVRKITPQGRVTTLAGLDADPLGIAVTGAATLYVADSASHTIRLGIPGGISIHFVANSKSSPSDSVDAALVPPADDNLLALEPIVGGLVADGVTPLLIEMQSPFFPAQSTTYQLAAGVSGGSLLNGGLSQYLQIFQPTSNGGGGQFVPGSTLTVSPSHPLGFAYISGIKSEDVQFAAGSKELTVTLSATQDGHTMPDASVQFRIRRPPVVLVHGYRSSNDAWGSDFLTTLQSSIPADFIMPVEGGVTRNGENVDGRESEWRV